MYFKVPLRYAQLRKVFINPTKLPWNPTKGFGFWINNADKTFKTNLSKSHSYVKVIATAQDYYVTNLSLLQSSIEIRPTLLEKWYGHAKRGQKDRQTPLLTNNNVFTFY